jgi:hypothetical protein
MMDRPAPGTGDDAVHACILLAITGREKGKITPAGLAS